AAKAEFDRCLEQDPFDVASRIGRAKCLKAVGQIDHARQDLQVALERDPSSADASRLLGEVEIQSGNKAAGLGLLREVVKRHPRIPDHRYALATALVVAGEGDEAREHFRIVDHTRVAQGKISIATRMLMDPDPKLTADEKLRLRFEIGSLALQ